MDQNNVKTIDQADDDSHLNGYLNRKKQLRAGYILSIIGCATILFAIVLSIASINSGQSPIFFFLFFSADGLVLLGYGLYGIYPKRAKEISAVFDPIIKPVNLGLRSCSTILAVVIIGVLVIWLVSAALGALASLPIGVLLAIIILILLRRG